MNSTSLHPDEQRGTTSPLCLARLAGLGWQLLDGVEPDVAVDRHWTGLVGRAELRVDGGRRIARFRWTLSGALAEPGAVRAGTLNAAAAEGTPGRDGVAIAQFATVVDDVMFLTSATDGGVVEDRHRVVDEALTEAFDATVATCRSVDPSVSGRTIRRVLADCLATRQIACTPAACAYFDGRLLPPQTTVDAALLGPDAIRRG